MKRRSLFKLLFSAPLATIGIKKFEEKTIPLSQYPEIKNFNPNLVGKGYYNCGLWRTPLGIATFCGKNIIIDLKIK